jgi:CheY-like chemotaxis protein
MMNDCYKRTFNVLLVEDNDDHALLITEALMCGEVLVKVERVAEGSEALARIATGRAPDAILLDLNMPGVNGHEVLEAIKSDPLLRMIPVVVLTTSLHHDDMKRAYRNHANSYLHKSFDEDSFYQLLDQFTKYWSSVNRINLS